MIRNSISNDKPILVTLWSQPANGWIFLALDEEGRVLFRDKTAFKGRAEAEWWGRLECYARGLISFEDYQDGLSSPPRHTNEEAVA